MTALLKIPLILASIIAADVTYTPPIPPPKPTEINTFDSNLDVMSKLCLWMPTVFKIMNWTLGLCEIATILAIQYPSAFSSNMLAALMNSSNLYTSNIQITSVYLAAWIVVILGGYIRQLCYRAMGRQFTFQLSVRDGHKLITTGPYSIVRHPSYSALVLVGIGMSICQFDAGSWLASCGWLNAPFGRGLGLLWIVTMNGVSVLLLTRVPKEDTVLRRQFGDQWIEWEKRTPYKLIPLLY